MKKINIENYKVNIETKEGIKEIPYDVKGSIKTVLFDSRQQLTEIGLCEAMDLWNKIKNETEEIILEDADYNILKRSFSIFKGWSEHDYEFVLRIKNPEDIKVKEVKEVKE